MEPFLHDPDLTLYRGDALSVLRELPDQSVHCCATSPPFFGLRDYGTGSWEGGDEGCEHIAGEFRRGTGLADSPHSTRGGAQKVLEPQPRYFGAICERCGAVRADGQIGLEDSPEAWVAALVDVFREVRRVLRDDGTFWVEIGDSYASSPAKGESGAGKNTEYLGDDGATTQTRRPIPEGVKPKDLIGQPWLLAKALRDPHYTGSIRNELDRVWLAAMVEAEGCMYVHKRKAGQERKSDTFGPGITVANTDRVLLERCAVIAGVGSISTTTRGRSRPIHRWCVLGQQARDLIRELYPYFVGKHHEARLAHACPTSGAMATRTHEALKSLHHGKEVDVDFKVPETLWEPGWYLRSTIIWSKPNCMPESATDRPTTAHSYVFLLTKSRRYFYDAEAIREPAEWARWGDQTAGKYEGEDAKGTMVRSLTKEQIQKRFGGGRQRGAGQGGYKTTDERNERFQGSVEGVFPQDQIDELMFGDGATVATKCPDGWASYEGSHGTIHRDGREDGERVQLELDAVAFRNSRSVWSIATEPNGNAICSVCGTFWPGKAPREHCGVKVIQHYAAFPTELVRRMIVAGCPPGGTVLDPFAGSGTTLLVAREQGRNSIGIELNESYARMIRARSQQQSLLA